MVAWYLVWHGNGPQGPDEEEEMLTPEERDGKIAELDALKVRGSLSDRVTLDKKDEIEKILHPLPPPWKWERLRGIAGLPSSAIAARTGFDSLRIRHWEQGGGVVRTGNWVDYAERLAEVIRELTGQDCESALAAAEESGVKDAAVQALVEQQRVTANSVTIWLSQGQSAACSQRDLELLRASMHITTRLLRQADKQLRRRVAAYDAAKAKTGREREGRDGTAGS